MAQTYTITIEAEQPPELLVGQRICKDAKITAIKLEKPRMVSASELSEKYGISTDTIRKKLASINKGTSGKHIYDPEQASLLLASAPTKRRGRPRANH